jgi:hypothetical protein
MEIDQEKAKRAAYKVGNAMFHYQVKHDQLIENKYLGGSMEWNGFNDAWNQAATGDDNFNMEAKG